MYDAIAKIVGTFFLFEKFYPGIILTLKILLRLGRILWSTLFLGLWYD